MRNGQKKSLRVFVFAKRSISLDHAARTSGGHNSEQDQIPNSEIFSFVQSRYPYNFKQEIQISKKKGKKKGKKGEKAIVTASSTPSHVALTARESVKATPPRTVNRHGTFDASAHNNFIDNALFRRHRKQDSDNHLPKMQTGRVGTATLLQDAAPVGKLMRNRRGGNN